jgi:hypothetical protein
MGPCDLRRRDPSRIQRRVQPVQAMGLCYAPAYLPGALLCTQQDSSSSSPFEASHASLSVLLGHGALMTIASRQITRSVDVDCMMKVAVTGIEPVTLVSALQLHACSVHFLNVDPTSHTPIQCPVV